MKNHWDCSCFKNKIEDKSCSLILHYYEKLLKNVFSETTNLQLSICKNNIDKLFILSRYAKQNNLLLSINYLNQPKGTVLRLRNRIEITIV